MKGCRFILQMIEQDNSDSLILAATNHPDILDYALFRRFDDVIQFKLPNKSLAIELIKNKMAKTKIAKLATVTLRASTACRICCPC